jgi:hypothetical protein
VIEKSFLRLAALTAALLTAGCGSGGEDPNILDAAAIYEANSAALASIRENYPGPFRDFARVPARNPANETREDKMFIKQLRKDFPVEFIDFLPMGETGKDEIDVVIKRYGADAIWTVVSLVYTEIPLPSPEEGSNVALFDKCDQRSLEWLEMDHDPGVVSAFCRINEYWYAYQSVN